MARALHARLEGKRVCFLSFLKSDFFHESVFNVAARKFCNRENLTFFDRNDLPWMRKMDDDMTRNKSWEVLQGISILEKEYDCLFIDEFCWVTILVYSSMYTCIGKKPPQEIVSYY